MISIVIYLLLVYSVGLLSIAAIAHWGWGLWEADHRKKWRVLLPLAVILLILPLIPYAVVEVQTHVYAKSLISAVQEAMHQIGFEDRIRSLKVLSVSRRTVTIYVVTPCLDSDSDYRACTVELVRTQNGWKFREGSDEIVWSDCGSAHGNIFPPYPSQGDYR